MATGGRYTNNSNGDELDVTWDPFTATPFTWIYSPERVEAWRRYIEECKRLQEEKRRRQDPRQIDAEMAIDMFQWCRENEGKPAMRNLSTGRSPTKMDAEYFLSLSETIGSKWVPLAIYLGFQEVDIDRLKADNQGVANQCRKMLDEWLKKQISNAGAMETLSQALQKAGRVDLALKTKLESHVPINAVVTNSGEVDNYRTECLKLILETAKKVGYVKDMFPGSFGEFECVHEGSVGVNLFVSVKSRPALDNLWNKCSNGTLAKELTKILITDELTTGDKSDLAIKATMLESDYQRACKFFDEQANGTKGKRHDHAGPDDHKHFKR